MSLVNKVFLAEGFILNGRYQIKSCLRNDPFVSLYHAIDLEREDFCTIRELFPLEATRGSDGFIRYPKLSKDEQFRLQHIFIEDAKKYSQINIHEFLSTREIFHANHTRYHVISSLENRTCLEDIWSHLSSLSLDVRLNIKRMIFKVLELFKAYKFTHFQLIPKNIYFNDQFSQITILPIARAQLWYSDRLDQSLQILDSFFTHPDCFHKNRRRTFHCDIYSISKIFSHLFPEKYLGTKTPEELEDLYMLFDHHFTDKNYSLEKPLKPKKFACPACSDLLEIVVPLANNVCPNCREGLLKSRKFALNACAHCKTGILHVHSNSSKLQYCPICQTGKLSYRHFLLKTQCQTIICLHCKEGFLKEKDKITRLVDRSQKSLDLWLKESQRSHITYECDCCRAQFDEKEDGQWKLYLHDNKIIDKKHLPEEWSRLAANVDVGSGNTFCDYCHSNFDLIQNRLTPIQSPYCSSNFFDFYQFQDLDLPTVKWLGVDKRSPYPGLVCKGCSTEFNKIDKDQWKLVWTKNIMLQDFTNEIHSLSEWHLLCT